PRRFSKIVTRALWRHVREDRGSKGYVPAGIVTGKPVFGTVDSAPRVIGRAFDVGPDKSKIGIGPCKALLQECDVFMIHVETKVGGSIENVAKRKGDPAETATNIEHRTGASQPCVDPQQHAPLLRPAEPLFENGTGLLTHERGRG